MKIEKKKVSDLKSADYNPRKDLKPGDSEFEQLRRSIEEFGYVEPVIWNKQTGNVVGGHQRLKVLKHLGLEVIDCVVIDITLQKEKALNIALNKISGSWDDALLASLLKDLDEGGFDVTLTGFSISETAELFGKGSLQNLQEDDFDIDESLNDSTKVITHAGDIWLLGRHKLLCGDCTKLEDVSNLMDGKKADLIVTDPPYNVDYESTVTYRENSGHKNTTRQVSAIANDNLSDENFYNFLFEFYTNAYKILKGGGVAYIFHSTKESVNFISAMKNAKFKVAQTLIWAKNHFTLGRQDYQWIHEPILYAWKEAKGCPHYFIDDRTNPTIFDLKLDIKKLKKEQMQELLEKIFSSYQTDIIHHDKPMRSDEHPTMKPITLCGKLIYNSSRQNELVYEPFAGSGSTLIASEQINRICYCIELDERYCDVIVKRYLKNVENAEIKLIRNSEIIGGKELLA